MFQELKIEAELGFYSINYITELADCYWSFFSTKAIIVKKAFADTQIDALTLLTLRMVFSLPFFVGCGLAGKQQDRQYKDDRKAMGFYYGVGIVWILSQQSFDFIGLQYISAGLERLILFLYPTFAVLINAYFLNRGLRASS